MGDQVMASAKIYVNPIDSVIDTKFLRITGVGYDLFNTPVIVLSNNKITIRIYFDDVDELKELCKKIQELITRRTSHG